MDHQNWEHMIIHGKNQKKKEEAATTAVRANRPGSMSCDERSLRTDDPEKPKNVDAHKSKILAKLRVHVLNVSMKQMAQDNNIPLPEYRDLENGTLIKMKATPYLQRIFNKYKKHIENMD